MSIMGPLPETTTGLPESEDCRALLCYKSATMDSLNTPMCIRPLFTGRIPAFCNSFQEQCW